MFLLICTFLIKVWLGQQILRLSLVFWIFILGISEHVFNLRRKRTWEYFEKLKFNLDVPLREATSFWKGLLRFLGEFFFRHVRDLRHLPINFTKGNQCGRSNKDIRIIPPVIIQNIFFEDHELTISIPTVSHWWWYIYKTEKFWLLNVFGNENHKLQNASRREKLIKDSRCQNS